MGKNQSGKGMKMGLHPFYIQHSILLIFSMTFVLIVDLSVSCQPISVRVQYLFSIFCALWQFYASFMSGLCQYEQFLLHLRGNGN